MRLFFYTALLLNLCMVSAGSVRASQDSATAPSSEKRLTNADVLDLLKSGLSSEIVIAKIAAAPCEFDTTPTALKKLKTDNVPDAVILAMVQAPSVSTQKQTPVLPVPSVEATVKGEPSVPAKVNCSGDIPVSVYAAPYSGSESIEVFRLSCGDRITLLNPSDKESWLKIRVADGREGYISAILVSKEQPPYSESQKQEDAQKANDDFEDCKVRSQNEYDTKMSAVGTMALTPIMRVAASNRLKQNLDAELRECRSEHESRLKAIDDE